jgi:5-bromo-4-chloroindolyl phosphate hydrolysis protein
MKFNSQWTNIEGWKKINGKQEKLKVLKKKEEHLQIIKLIFFFVNLASTWC